MQLTTLFGANALSSTVLAYSLIGATIASPFGAVGARDYSPPQSSAPPSSSAANNADLIAKLLTASTAVERSKLLKDEDYAYDFNNPPEGATTTGMGGHTVKADRKAFPALIGTSTSMTIGFLDGCGFNTPHTHPRSAEFNVVVRGALNAEFIAENGEQIVRHNATEFQAIIFPRGAVHTEFNPNCEKAVFVAGFADEDPGVQQSAQTLFGLDGNVLEAALATKTFGGSDLSKFKDHLPVNVFHGVGDCLKRCEGKIEKS